MHITFGRNQAIAHHSAKDLPLAWELLEIVCPVDKNIGQALGGREEDLGRAKQAAKTDQTVIRYAQQELRVQ
jgi:hypothetical protein